jgi:hypothetical protein
VREKLTVHAARKQGIRLSEDEIQQRADQFRRVRGLHRATEMNHYLDALGVSLDEFERFITDGLYQEKMLATDRRPGCGGRVLLVEFAQVRRNRESAMSCWTARAKRAK